MLTMLDSERHLLETATNLIKSVLDGESSPDNQTIYLEVAGEYCYQAAAMELEKWKLMKQREVDSQP